MRIISALTGAIFIQYGLIDLRLISRIHPAISISSAMNEIILPKTLTSISLL